MKKVVFSLLLVVMMYGEDINFDELRKAGTMVEKSVIITGIASQGQSYIKRFSEIDDQRAAREGSYSSSGEIKFVLVHFDVMCGLLGSCLPKNLKIWGGPGRFEGGKGSSYGAIHKGYNNALAGQYKWVGEYGNDGRTCAGSFYLSGTKRNYAIRVFDNCRDSSSGEF